MTTRTLGCLAAVTLLTLAPACDSDDEDGDGIEITDAWARTSPIGVKVGAAYFVIESPTDDTLEGASVEPTVAGDAQLHMTMGDDDATMTMEEMPGIDLAAGEAENLEPLGTHVMLVDLSAALITGDTFELTLQFAEADDEVVTVEVRDEAP